MAKSTYVNSISLLKTEKKDIKIKNKTRITCLEKKVFKLYDCK